MKREKEKVNSWIEGLVGVYRDWSINTSCELKRINGDFAWRYFWRAEKAFIPDRGKSVEARWEGFATHKGMLQNIERVLSAESKKSA